MENMAKLIYFSEIKIYKKERLRKINEGNKYMYLRN